MHEVYSLNFKIYPFSGLEKSQSLYRKFTIFRKNRNLTIYIELVETVSYSLCSNSNLEM